MAVIYKRTERERERDWETQSQGGPRSYTTVRRYKVPEHSLEEDTYEQEMRLVHRPREDYLTVLDGDQDGLLTALL